MINLAACLFADLHQAPGFEPWERLLDCLTPGRVAEVMQDLETHGKLAAPSAFLRALKDTQEDTRSRVLPSGETENSFPSAVEQKASEVSSPLKFVPRAWLETGRRGVRMIYAPAINPDTVLHFSWQNDSCALRDYSKSPTIMPLEDRTKLASDVRKYIVKEIPIRNRHRINDVDYWHRTTTDLNRSELPSGTDGRTDSSDAERGPGAGQFVQSSYTEEYPQLKTDCDLDELKLLLAELQSAMKRQMDKDFAERLAGELLEDNVPRMSYNTMRQFAKWCKTGGIYADAMLVAQKISLLLFGVVLDRDKFGA